MGLPFDDRLEVMDVFWDMSERLMTAVARDYRQYATGEVMHRRSEKNELIMLLSAEEPDSIAIVSKARSLSLDTSYQYRVVLGIEGGLEWMETIERACSTGGAPAVAGEFNGHLAAVIPAGPARPSHSDLLFAVGGPRTLGSLSGSWEEAKLVRASLPKGASGWHDLRSRSWRIAVAAVPAVGQLARSIYLDALADEPDQGDMLLHSVWTFIGTGFSYRKASEQLFVHENTLRYRVAKFEELTSRSVMDVDTRMEMAWLRHARTLDASIRPSNE